MAGMIATFINVSDPAIAFALATSIPSVMAFAFALSSHFPITGKINETENIPAPPINESPNAPVFGKYSDTNPSIVGQKKQMPIANMAAEPKAA